MRSGHLPDWSSTDDPARVLAAVGRLNPSISNCLNIKCQCYQSVWIRLAHRLYIDFQYFFICHGGNDQEDGSDDDKIFLVSLNRSS